MTSTTGLRCWTERDRIIEYNPIMEIVLSHQSIYTLSAENRHFDDAAIRTGSQQGVSVNCMGVPYPRARFGLVAANLSFSQIRQHYGPPVAVYQPEFAQVSDNSRPIFGGECCHDYPSTAAIVMADFIGTAAIAETVAVQPADGIYGPFRRYLSADSQEIHIKDPKIMETFSRYEGVLVEEYCLSNQVAVLEAVHELSHFNADQLVE